MHIFENVLSVCIENIEFEFRNYPFAEWSNFLLNPRRLRGSDFLMRWSQGVWSEERITQAVNQTNEFFAIPYVHFEGGRMSLNDEALNVLRELANAKN